MTSSLFKSLSLSAAGVIIEWYDFAIYLYMAPILGRLFFPASDPRTQLFAAYGLFATGYIVRPLGALFYGALGDRIGRKKTLITSSILMAACKLFEGLLPTYASVGITAPVMLLVMRMASGFSMGGEYAGTFVYLVENAPQRQRATICSIANTMCAGGIFLASLVVSLIAMLPAQNLDAWGWRIPFFVGALAGLVAMAMRVHMQESPLFDQVVAEGRTSRSPVRDALQTVPCQIVQAFFLASYIAITYHVFIAFVPGYLQTYCGVEKQSADWIATAASLLNLPLMMLPAWLSDRVGRKPVLIGAAIAVLTLSWPIFTLMSSGHALAGALLGVPLAAAINAPAATLAVELFPTRVRFSAFAIGFNLGSIAGGIAPVACLNLIKITEMNAAPAFLVIGASLVMLAVLPLLPETRNRELV